MRTIMVMNAKGGCGKTTLAVNIATWYADEGYRVALADFDTQGSSLDWLQARQDYEGIPDIAGIDVTSQGLRAPRGTDYLIMDVPAGIHGKAINETLRRVETLIIPVLPSPLDIRAARRFVQELLGAGRVSRHQTRIGMVANRVRENTVVYHELEEFLNEISIPFIGKLRESQNYIRSAERGLGVFELAPSMVATDLLQWDPVIEWLNKES
jgi:chromosome partitioning protein